MRNLEFCDSPRLGAMEKNSIPHGMTMNRIKGARYDDWSEGMIMIKKAPYRFKALK